MSVHSNVTDTASQNQYGMGKKTLGVYLFGFFTCIVLTLLPFYAVMQTNLAKPTLLTIIISAAIVQLIVQVLCFLRLNTKDEQALTNMLSFLMIIVVLFIVVGGSLWIMFSLNYNMVH